jgi:hypothetical protein
MKYSLLAAQLIMVAYMVPALAQGTPKQTVTTEGGGIFMEEVDSKRPDQQGSKTAPKVEMKRAPDVSELGVPVTTSGRIVPIIQPESPVMQMGSQLQMYREPGLTAVPWWSGAAGLPGTVPYTPGFGVPFAGGGYYPGLSSPYLGGYYPATGFYPGAAVYPGVGYGFNPYLYGGYGLGFRAGGLGIGLGYNSLSGYGPAYTSPGAAGSFRISGSNLGFSIGGGPRWVSPYSYGSSILSPLIGY